MPYTNNFAQTSLTSFCRKGGALNDEEISAAKKEAKSNGKWNLTEKAKEKQIKQTIVEAVIRKMWSWIVKSIEKQNGSTEDVENRVNENYNNN